MSTIRRSGESVEAGRNGGSGMSGAIIKCECCGRTDTLVQTPSWCPRLCGACDADERIYRAMKVALGALAPHGDPDDDVELVGPLWGRLLTTGLAAALARGPDPALLCERLNEALESNGSPYRLVKAPT